MIQPSPTGQIIYAPGGIAGNPDPNNYVRFKLLRQPVVPVQIGMLADNDPPNKDESQENVVIYSDEHENLPQHAMLAPEISTFDQRHTARTAQQSLAEVSVADGLEDADANPVYGDGANDPFIMSLQRMMGA